MLTFLDTRKYLIMIAILMLPVLAACGGEAPAAPGTGAQPTAASGQAGAQPTQANTAAGGTGGSTVLANCPEGFPNKPITFITWSNPGGGGDVLGRAMIAAIQRQKLLPQPVVIENRAGGSGAVAMSHVAQLGADPHTVLIVTKNLTLTPLTQNLDTDYQDFNPIQRTQLEPFFVAVRADAPWNSLKDMVEDAKGGDVTFGGAFAGSTDNMMFSLLAEEAGFDLTYVPFESGGEAATALVGGDVDAISASPQETQALVDAGKVKFLATPSAERTPFLPDLPTFKEEGFDVTLEQWRGFVYHKDVSDEYATCMDGVLREAAKDPGFQKYTKESGLSEGYVPGDEFYQQLKAETEANRKFLKEAGLLEQ